MSLGMHLRAGIRLAAWTARAELPGTLTISGLILILAVGLAETFAADPPAVAAPQAVRAALGLGGVVGMLYAGVLGARILAGGHRRSPRPAVLASPAGPALAVCGTLGGLVALAGLVAGVNVGAAMLAAGLSGGRGAPSPSPLRPWVSQPVLDRDSGPLLVPPGGSLPLRLPPAAPLGGTLLVDLDLIPSLRLTREGLPGHAAPVLEVLDRSGEVVGRVALEELALGGFARVAVPLPATAMSLRLSRPAAADPIVLRAGADRCAAWVSPASLAGQVLAGMASHALDLATTCLAGALLAAMLPSAAGAAVAVVGGTMIVLLLPGAVARSRDLRVAPAAAREDPLLAAPREFALGILRLTRAAVVVIPPLRTPHITESLAAGAAIPPRRVLEGSGRLLVLALLAAGGVVLRLRGWRR